MALTPWDHQIFDFGWDDYGPSIVQCSSRNITMDDRRESTVKSTRPYAVNVLASGHLPQSANITVFPDGSILWIVDIALGIGPHILYMTDAKGYTGGTSLAFEMTANSTCTTRPWTPNQLDLDVFGEGKQCSTMVVTMHNGTAPYTLQTIVGERPPKTTHWLSTELTYVVDLGVSEKFFLVVTDALNMTAVSGLYTVGAGQTNSCFNVAATLLVGSEDTSTYSTSVNTASIVEWTASSTPSSSPSDKAPVSTPVIVGAAVGSFAFVAFLIGIVVFLCLRRRTKKKPKNQPIDLSADDKAHYLRSPSIFVPFDYQPRPPSSPREEFSDYGHSSSPGARVTGSPSSQALLFGWDSTSRPNNPHSGYSMYSRGTTSSGTQWGELLSTRNSALVPTPHPSLTPSAPPIQEKQQLVATNTSERDATSPVAVNRLRSAGGSPPPPSYD